MLADLPPPAKKPPPRYWESLALPPFRYAPGSDRPHPLDPDGHMKGVAPAGADIVNEMAWMLDPRWLYGVDLYNNWFFWEAHEVWDPLWKGLDKATPAALFIQGLMQCAGGLLKVHAADPHATAAFWGKAEVRLGKCADARDALWGLKTLKTFKSFRKYFTRKELQQEETTALTKHVPRLVLLV